MTQVMSFHNFQDKLFLHIILQTIWLCCVASQALSWGSTSETLTLKIKSRIDILSDNASKDGKLQYSNHLDKSNYRFSFR